MPCCGKKKFGERERERVNSRLAEGDGGDSGTFGDGGLAALSVLDEDAAISADPRVLLRNRLPFSSVAAAVRHVALRLLSVFAVLLTVLGRFYTGDFLNDGVSCVRSHLQCARYIGWDEGREKTLKAVTDPIANGGELPASSLMVSDRTFPLCCL